MNSHKCDKCGNTIFVDAGEVLAAECPKCGHIVNPNYEQEMNKGNGPTFMEWVDAGESALKYPPAGYDKKPLTEADLKRIDEMSEAESNHNALLVEHKALKATHEKMIASAKADNHAKAAAVKAEDKEVKA